MCVSRVGPYIITQDVHFQSWALYCYNNTRCTFLSMPWFFYFLHYFFFLFLFLYYWLIALEGLPSLGNFFFLVWAGMLQTKLNPAPHALTWCYCLFASFFMYLSWKLTYATSFKSCFTFLCHSALIFQSKPCTVWLCLSEVLSNSFWPEMLCYTSKKGWWEVLRTLHLEKGKQIGS